MFDNTLINVTSALMIFQTLLKKNLKKIIKKNCFYYVSLKVSFKVFL